MYLAQLTRHAPWWRMEQTQHERDELRLVIFLLGKCIDFEPSWETAMRGIIATDKASIMPFSRVVVWFPALLASGFFFLFFSFFFDLIDVFITS